MLYDYIVESYLVIEYVDDKNRNSMLTTNCERKYYYLDNSLEQNKEVKNILLHLFTFQTPIILTLINIFLHL